MKHESLYRIYLAYYAAKLAGGVSLSMQLPSVATTEQQVAVARGLFSATEPIAAPLDYADFAELVDDALAPPEAE